MKLIDMKLIEFSNEVDSPSPAPGGGSVSAYSGILGVSLALMVGHLTVGKKKFNEKDPAIKDAFIASIQKLKNIKEALIPLVDLDTEAFELIMKAYKLPKDTNDEQSERKKAIVRATLEAIHVPQQVASLSLQALASLDMILKHCNPSTISDLGVAVLHLASAVEGACMNVRINTPGLDIEDQKNEYMQLAIDWVNQSNTLKSHLLSNIYTKI
jgi:formiminotetrahydrofolate cyclodeaminase